MAMNECAQTDFVCVQRRSLQQFAQFVHRDTLVHLVQPGFHLVKQFEVWLLRQIPFLLWEGNLDFELFPQGQIDWEYRAILTPLRLPGNRGLWGSWVMERRSRLVHGCVTHAQGPCRNRTATALRPS